MTSRLLITRGVPGSGKSTYARKWVDENPSRRVRINRDDIRFMLFGKYWGVDEKAVTRVQDTLLRAAIADGKDVILDNTNLQSKNVIDTLKIAAETRDVFVQFNDFEISFEKAVARDAARDRTVGEDVIRGFYDRFMGGVKNPRFPEVPRLPAEWVFEPHQIRVGLPSAILVDIDGTLAHSGQYDVYNGAHYINHGFDLTVASAVQGLSREAVAKVIIMSGRDSTYRRETEEWLMENEFNYDELYMRAVGDVRNDAVIKNELFETHITGRYNALAVFDDRPRVVRLWQKKGIKVFNVGIMDIEF